MASHKVRYFSIWLKMIDKHIWYLDFSFIGLRGVFISKIVFRSGLLFWFPLSVLFHKLFPEYSISQHDYRIQDLAFFTLSLNRIYWGKAVLMFLWGRRIYGNESLSLNHFIWNAISKTIVLPLTCLCVPSASRHSVLLLWCLPDDFLKLRVTSLGSLTPSGSRLTQLSQFKWNSLVLPSCRELHFSTKDI